jgi:glycerol-3-phosphate acyltransferase PlsY
MEFYYFLGIAYLIGSIPFSLWIVKSATGEDLRDHFSKNAGATNASRVLKKFLGEEKLSKARFLHKLIFVMDVLKGAAAVTLMQRFGSTQDPWPILAGILAVVGHSFPIFAGFRGGKGVATCLGLIFGLTTVVAAVTFAIWALVTLISRFVSVGSCVAALSMPVIMYYYHGAEHLNNHKLTTGLLVLLSVFIVLKHLSNIKRVFAGTEPRVGEKVS